MKDQVILLSPLPPPPPPRQAHPLPHLSCNISVWTKRFSGIFNYMYVHCFAPFHATCECWEKPNQSLTWKTMHSPGRWREAGEGPLGQWTMTFWQFNSLPRGEKQKERVLPNSPFSEVDGKKFSPCMSEHLARTPPLVSNATFTSSTPPATLS